MRKDFYTSRKNYAVLVFGLSYFALGFSCSTIAACPVTVSLDLFVHGVRAAVIAIADRVQIISSNNVR